MAVAPTASTDVAARFLDALGRRDYEALAACFDEDATMRAIVPPGVREDDGREAIAARFRLWTADAADYELLDTEASLVADVLRLRYAARATDAGADEPTMFEQTAYAEVRDGLITKLRLACSGDRPLA